MQSGKFYSSCAFLLLKINPPLRELEVRFYLMAKLTDIFARIIARGNAKLHAEQSGQNVTSFDDSGNSVTNIIQDIKPDDTYRDDWQQFRQVLRKNGITKLYHFTDKDNLLSIQARCGLYSWRYCEKNNIAIPYPGGDKLSRELDTRKELENYVRLSFVENHPMLYVAQREGRIKNPIVLEISIEVIFQKGTKFTTQNAVQKEVKSDESFETFNSIKFPLFTKDYRDLNEEEKHYYQAEVLVCEHIPLRYILNYNNPKPPTPVRQSFPNPIDF